MISIPAFAIDLPVKLGAFLDTYYAFDLNAPANHERQYTTQPVRHNEFNINLAYIEAVVNRETTRGRLAFQLGNSATKNSAFERTKGATSGQAQAMPFQEAWIGKKLGERTWLEGGIFLGNIGAESWISKNNWTYTRALNLDYVPYYSAGVRLDHRIDDKQSLMFQILNGWQNVTETNTAKALGFQYQRTITPALHFTYNNFLGDEQVVPDPKTGAFKTRFRGYHNFVLKYLASDQWQFLSALDFGHQSQQSNTGVDGWGAATLTVRRVLTSSDSIAARAEYYNDRHQANVYTGTRNGFDVYGASVNFDRKLDDFTLWRTELRALDSKDKIFPKGKRDQANLDVFAVTSLSLWI